MPYTPLYRDGRGYRAFGKVFEDYDVGFKFLSVGRTLNTEDITIFAGLTGDFERIHTDEAYAHKYSEPYKTRIAQGLLTFVISEGLLLRRGFFESIEEAQFVELKNLRFTAPVIPGDTISAEFEVIDKRDTDNPDYGIITIRRTVKNQNGETVLRAETSGMKKKAKPAQGTAVKRDEVEPALAKGERDKRWISPSKTFTETDLVMFSDIFLTPLLKGREK